MNSRTITINLPSKDELDSRATGIRAAVEAMEIDSDSMLAIAAEQLVSLKADHKMFEEARQRHVCPLNDEVRYINERYKGPLRAMEQAETALKHKILDYQNGQGKRREELQAIIETAHRTERARLAAKEEADPEQRAANELAAIVMTAPVLPRPQKLPGISRRFSYKGKCTNLLDLVRHIATHPEHIGLVKPNDSAITQIARAQGGACQIDGILVYQDTTLTVRGA